MTVSPLTARKTWRTLEPIHGLIYFAPEATDAYAALGVTGRSGYFASRSAPMGAVPADVVIATFFNFEPGLVRGAMDGVWDIASPAQLLAARLEAAGAMLRRTLGDLAEGAHVEEAATLARAAADHATQHLWGKPLFGGHASLPWPEDPLLVLWHAQSLLREFRGDIHIAAMTVAGIDGCEALVTHAASGEIASTVLQSSRAWSDDGWAAAVDSLRAKGHLDADGAFTDKGRASRQWVEDETDAGAAVAYAPIGEDGCDRLRLLCRPMSKAVVASGGLGFR
ncbi:MAG: hypothetical protein QOJ00_2907 [Actinomycetota bacterium]|jgi:hypothetical protein